MIKCRKRHFIPSHFCKHGQCISDYHYWKTVLCRVPETLPSAFYRGTRQSLALGKTGLCRVPRHSAKIPLGKRWPARDGGHLPSDFAECLTAGTRQFFFIFKNLFCRLLTRGTRQFFLFLKTYFAECQPQALDNFF